LQYLCAALWRLQGKNSEGEKGFPAIHDIWWKSGSASFLRAAFWGDNKG
jgi:hypothetical protein